MKKLSVIILFSLLATGCMHNPHMTAEEQWRWRQFGLELYKASQPQYNASPSFIKPQTAVDCQWFGNTWTCY